LKTVVLFFKRFPHVRGDELNKTMCKFSVN
jgi:hypothetical protein